MWNKNTQRGNDGAGDGDAEAAPRATWRKHLLLVRATPLPAARVSPCARPPQLIHQRRYAQFCTQRASRAAEPRKQRRPGFALTERGRSHAHGESAAAVIGQGGEGSDEKNHINQHLFI